MKRGIVFALGISIALGALTVSCEKEQVKPAQKGEVKTTVEHNKDGGDDDDDPVIRGKVKNKNTFATISGAYVETFVYIAGTSVGTKFTDSSGDFELQVSKGIYYFKITPPGGSTVTTDTVHVNNDVNITLSI